MSLASPDKLIWLLAAVPIIAFYILRTRLRRRPVSTLLFWEQVFEQKRQRALWQNLRHWMSLLLQLAFVGFVGFALADPLWKSQADLGQDLILIVDRSASMQAVDPDSGKTRFQQAIERAGEVAKGLRDGDNIALVSAAGTIKVEVGMSDFAPTVEEALLKLTPSDSPTRIADAVMAARRLAPDDEKRRIVVFSDGAHPDEASLPVDDDVRYVQVGSSSDNTAITTFQVRRSTVDPVGYSLLVEVKNLSDDEVETRLTLTLDEMLIDVFPLTLAANEVFRKQIDGVSQAGGVLTGEIEVEDGLAIDNAARAVLPPRPDIPVAVNLAVDPETGEPQSYYLQRVLESIPLVRLIEKSDEVAGADSAGTDDASSNELQTLHVYAGVLPETLPGGPVLLVNLPADGPLIEEVQRPAWKVGPAIESPIIAKQNKQSPLLRHVRLQNVALAGGRDVDVDQEFGKPETLLETADGAKVCVAVERPEGRVLILAADLDSSDLPLRIAFPVLMTNAMNWFYRQTGEIRPALSTGNPATVVWDRPQVESETGSTSLATLIRPTGNRSLVTIDKERARLGPLGEVGLYQLTNAAAGEAAAAGELGTRGKSEPEADRPANVAPEPGDVTPANQATTNGMAIAVNLANAAESDLRLQPLPETNSGELPPAGRSPWFYLIVAAAVLVITEWALFQRRVVA